MNPKDIPQDMAVMIGDEILTYTSITGTTVNGLVRGQAVAGGRGADFCVPPQHEATLPPATA